MIDEQILDEKLLELFNLFKEYRDQYEHVGDGDNIENFALAVKDRLNALLDA